MPMFVVSAPLGFQRSCASGSGISGSAAAPGSGSALVLHRFCNLVSNFLLFSEPCSSEHLRSPGRFWARLPKRGVCLIPGENVEALLVHVGSFVLSRVRSCPLLFNLVYLSSLLFACLSMLPARSSLVKRQAARRARKSARLRPLSPNSS